MSDQNSPEVSNPSPDSREAIKRSINDKLDAMQQKIDDDQRNEILTFIQNEKLSEETLKNVDRLLQEAQRAYNSNPVLGMQIMNTILITGADGEISQAEVRNALNVPEGSEVAQRIGGAIEKMTSLMNGLGSQLGALGSGTMKMLEGMFGPDTFFGKIFAYLKNTPQAQAAYLVKKLEEQGKSLDPKTNQQAVLGLLRSQIVEGQNIERRAKRNPPTYDIVQHTEQLMAELDPNVSVLTLEAMKAAGQEVLKRYPADIAATVPPPVPEAVTAQTPPLRRNAIGKISTAISATDTGMLDATFTGSQATLVIGGKKTTINNIEGIAISKVDLLDATATNPAAVIFTRSDNVEVQVDATALKTAAEKANGPAVMVVGKNLKANAEVTLELQFY